MNSKGHHYENNFLNMVVNDVTRLGLIKKAFLLDPKEKNPDIIKNILQSNFYFLKTLVVKIKQITRKENILLN